MLNDVISHLAAILEQVAADASITLGEIRLDDDRGATDAPYTLACVQLHVDHAPLGLSELAADKVPVAHRDFGRAVPEDYSELL